ncbi:MAG: endonuclease/exonuclease/phosphatase family protein, partial [Turicibacter sp.]|nr:endonuclease/exonuclease/phosphatase family protein [Turicibacter sp.]
YIVYMNSSYYRIEDDLSLEVINNQNLILEKDTEYSIMTYNIGFGAYDQEYSFFMNVGTMKDGTVMTGKSSRGVSEENVLKNTKGSINLINELATDFILLQEVDVKATRSYQINQKEMIENSLSDYGRVFALNFHSSYMLYPFHEPHGSVEAGLLTLSRYQISLAKRMSYPIDNSFLAKFLDLDRCFIVTRYEVANGKELVLINNHMSAYDEGGMIRAKQLELLNTVMKQEYDQGNYVIVGGDFNHVLNIDEEAFSSEQLVPSWVNSLSDEELPDGMKIVNASNNLEVATCRDSDIPYTKGVNYVTILDGFIISDNIVAVAENIDADFMYSDHNPVKLTFKLK